ncbi:MAG TPA: fasciclin domain-containing protein, partial [Bacteroidales bacterium]|nr:fasciclin domain-containing protein [Bacteroidales bacterium]
TGEDYRFYFDRPYEYGELFYANAKITGDEIFAENGFVYTIDQVVEPLNNTEEILEDGPYEHFLQLIHNKSVFKYNEEATLAQEGADEGADVDKLYTLSYPSLPFAIHDEEINTFRNTLERHNGILAPSDQGMDEFFDEYLSAYGTWSNVPEQIEQLFLISHLTSEPIYPKDIREGFYTTVNDLVVEDDLSINAVEFATNSTFIGLEKPIVPKYFSSVSAPLLLDPSFSSFFYSYVATGLLSTLKDQNTEFSFFIEDDQSIANDSTIIIERGERRLRITGYDMAEEKFVPMMGPEYRDIFKRRLYGHIGVQPLLGIAKREFIETLDGRHIVVQNDTVSGGVPSEFGLNSGNDTTVVFSEITDFTMNNGRAFQCNGWLKFTNERPYNHFRNTKFLQLLDELGMANIQNQKLPFLDPSERYTIFIPSDAALDSINIDNYTLEQKRELVGFHIVKGDLIFTDGRENMGSYRTYDNNFINLDPKPDNLIILDENNDVYYDDLELSSKSNLMCMYLQNLDEDYYITNAVVHKIDTVIMPY